MSITGSSKCVTGSIQLKLGTCTVTAENTKAVPTSIQMDSGGKWNDYEMQHIRNRNDLFIKNNTLSSRELWNFFFFFKSDARWWRFYHHVANVILNNNRVMETPGNYMRSCWTSESLGVRLGVVPVSERTGQLGWNQTAGPWLSCRTRTPRSPATQQHVGLFNKQLLLLQRQSHSATCWLLIMLEMKKRLLILPPLCCPNTFTRPSPVTSSLPGRGSRCRPLRRCWTDLPDSGPRCHGSPRWLLLQKHRAHHRAPTSDNNNHVQAGSGTKSVRKRLHFWFHSYISCWIISHSQFFYIAQWH